MHAHIIQHVPFEGPGSIATWLDAHGWETTTIHAYATPGFPDPADTDLLVIMGGPMSVNDEAAHPWIVAEKQFVREVIERGKSVLGVCLGAQLIANTLGAKVFPNSEREIGWFPIHAVDAPDPSAFRFPPTTTVFHWHGETFELPARAARLASSEVCANQAFQIGKHVIGLQFHLETTAECATSLVSHCGDELTPAPRVQSAETILAATPEQYAAIHELMDSILVFLTS